MKTLKTLTFLSLILFTSCVLEDSSLTLKVKPKTEAGTILQASIADLTVDQTNKQIILTGTDLDQVDSVKIEGPGVNETFTIATQTATSIELIATQAVGFALGGLFNLIITDAQGATGTFSITFDLATRSIDNIV